MAIVENRAIDYDSDDAFGLTTRPTDVVATNYRQFVSQHPTRTSYFQPVIEQLQYVFPEVLGSPPFLLVEGITDYYALKIIYDQQPAQAFRLMPGIGSGAAGPQIGAMLGRGEKFMILLDDDAAGRREAKKYRDEWYLTDTDVITLADVDPKFAGMAIEKLLSIATRSAIAGKLQKTSPSKKEIGWYLSEVCADSNSTNLFDAETKSNLEKILVFASKKLLG